MRYQNAEQLAEWLMKNQPALFTALAKRAEARAQLSGITDFFSSLGTGLANASKQVASFVSSQEGMSALTGLTGIYLKNKADKDALKLQLRLAEAGQPLAPVATANDIYGSGSSYYYPPNGGAPIPMSPGLVNSLAPRQSGIAEYLPWIGIAAVLGLFAVTLSRR